VYGVQKKKGDRVIKEDQDTEIGRGKEKKGGRKTKFLVMSLYLLSKSAPTNMPFY
jgi:hypothetical protein